MSAIRVDGVSKRFRIPLDHSTTLKYRVTHLRSASRYRDLDALREISFDVQPGEFVGICGRNGSGKSTLLKVLSRIYRPDSGSVVIEGRVSPFLELGVGFNPELTARENVFVNASILGLTRREIRLSMDEIIGFAELEEFADQKLKNFSSGMQVRLAFAIAVRADAQVLLMDEVLAVGDARFQQKCFDVFDRYRDEGKTVVLVTHDLAAIEQRCDRAILLDHGRLLADGPPKQVVADYLRLVGIDPDAGAGGTPAAAGNGDLRIDQVRLCGQDGGELSVFGTGAPLVLEIEYEVHRPLQRFACELTLNRSDGMAISGLSSHGDGAELVCPAPGEHGAIRYEVRSLPLLGGSYDFSIELAATDGPQVFASCDHVGAFTVVDERERDGLVTLDGRWSDGELRSRVAAQRRGPAQRR